MSLWKLNSALVASALISGVLAYGPWPASAQGQPVAEAPAEAAPVLAATATDPVVEGRQPVAPSPEPASVEATPGALSPEALAQGAAAATKAPPSVSPIKPAAAPPGPPLEVVQGEIKGSLTATLQRRTSRREAPALAAVTSRLMVWWLSPRRDLLRGDALRLAYERREGAEPRLHALTIVSGKKGREFRAYGFQPEGAPYFRYYDAQGDEIELSLDHGPLAEYEQVTSLLHDGRRHQGVDFKVPEGAEVLAPFDGVVVRRNWSYRRTGHCLHLRSADGVNALFLHLSEVPASLKPGTRVERGQVLAFSGNTGRSTAPHLHYQLQSDDRQIIDPYRFHKTRHARLAPEQLPAFKARVKALDALLDQPPAGSDS